MRAGKGSLMALDGPAGEPAADLPQPPEPAERGGGGGASDAHVDEGGAKGAGRETSGEGPEEGWTADDGWTAEGTSFPTYGAQSEPTPASAPAPTSEPVPTAGQGPPADGADDTTPADGVQRGGEPAAADARNGGADTSTDIQDRGTRPDGPGRPQLPDASRPDTPGTGDGPQPVTDPSIDPSAGEAGEAGETEPRGAVQQGSETSVPQGETSDRTPQQPPRADQQGDGAGTAPEPASPPYSDPSGLGRELALEPEPQPAPQRQPDPVADRPEQSGPSEQAPAEHRAAVSDAGTDDRSGETDGASGGTADTANPMEEVGQVIVGVGEAGAKGVETVAEVVSGVADSALSRLEAATAEAGFDRRAATARAAANADHGPGDGLEGADPVPADGGPQAHEASESQGPGDDGSGDDGPGDEGSGTDGPGAGAPGDDGPGDGGPGDEGSEDDSSEDEGYDDIPVLRDRREHQVTPTELKVSRQTSENLRDMQSQEVPLGIDRSTWGRFRADFGEALRRDGLTDGWGGIIGSSTKFYSGNPQKHFPSGEDRLTEMVADKNPLNRTESDPTTELRNRKEDDGGPDRPPGDGAGTEPNFADRDADYYLEKFPQSEEEVRDAVAKFNSPFQDSVAALQDRAVDRWREAGYSDGRPLPDATYFDSAHHFHFGDPSDYDIDLCSDEAAARFAAYGAAHPEVKVVSDKGFYKHDSLHEVAPAVADWAARWTDELGREVRVATFDSRGTASRHDAEEPTSWPFHRPDDLT
ncbi:hypothetical protein ADK90_30445 [Streptomyces sp. XY413]|nr:hypothetical protein ADK90_30445 [Streptomyces sp. XY413]